VRSWPILVALAGCDYVFRLDEVATNSNGDARHDSVTGGGGCTISTTPFAPTSCSSAFGGTPVELEEFAGTAVGDPSIRGDQLEIFYTTYFDGHTILAYATRQNVTSPFVLAHDPPYADPSSTEFDQTVSASGEYVAFISNRGGAGYHTYLAHRACNTWEVVPIPGLETTVMASVELSYDAKAVYFGTASHEIYEARRSSTDQPFGEPMVVVANGDWPGVSSDELEIYFTQSTVGGVFRATRTNVGTQFGQTASATAFGGDPDLTPDGRTLVLLRTGNSLQVLQRSCP
jgi:hypothetical protein